MHLKKTKVLTNKYVSKNPWMSPELIKLMTKKNKLYKKCIKM